MPRYRITTLVDITRDIANRAVLTDREKLQQANFNSLRQAIELRAIIQWDKNPTKHSGRLPEPLDGRAEYWVWEFETERDDLFLRDNDQTALLKEDLHGVPIISGLDETVELSPAAIQTLGKNTNTVVEII
jgi:hypothetical protein